MRSRPLAVRDRGMSLGTKANSPEEDLGQARLERPRGRTGVGQSTAEVGLAFAFDPGKCVFLANAIRTSSIR